MYRRILLIPLLLLMACDQVPTSTAPNARQETTPDAKLTLTLQVADYDFLSQELYLSLALVQPTPQVLISGTLEYGGGETRQLVLHDDGRSNDIQAADGRYDVNLDIGFSGDSAQTWALHLLARDTLSGASVPLDTALSIRHPDPPRIESVVFRDTLTLRPDSLVLDTLRVRVSPPNGLDEIRDVSMMSLKPNGEYANNGQPIPLYDDGSETVFFTFQGIDFTSGDRIAGDGEYALLLVLDPSTLTGVYGWTFNARTWLGTDAESWQDSLVVLPPPGLLPIRDPGTPFRQGVFR